MTIGRIHFGAAYQLTLDPDTPLPSVFQFNGQPIESDYQTRRIASTAKGDTFVILTDQDRPHKTQFETRAKALVEQYRQERPAHITDLTELNAANAIWTFQGITQPTGTFARWGSAYKVWQYWQGLVTQLNEALPHANLKTLNARQVFPIVTTTPHIASLTTGTHANRPTVGDIASLFGELDVDTLLGKKP